MLPREFVKYQDKLYWVYRKVNVTQIKEGYTNDVKELWYCDVVIKNTNNNVLLFLRLVEDAEIVRDVI